MSNNSDSQYIFNQIDSHIKKLKTDSKIFNDDEITYEILSSTKDYLYEQIHRVLSPNRKMKQFETKIRDYVRYIIDNILPLLKRKVDFYRDLYTRSNEEKRRTIAYQGLKYTELWDDFKALASFRSFAHFALYIEEDEQSLDKVWCHTMETSMGGIFYYGNEMILNHTYQYMVKQCPTGYGKCVLHNTKLLTPNGLTTIKEINIGDEVYSMENRKLVKQKVTNKWETRKKQYKVKTKSGKEITISPEHRMFTQRDYVMAKDLDVNRDYLYLLKEEINNNIDSDFVYDKIVSIEYIDVEEEMYDIEVSNTHNFIMNGLVSHNSKSDNYTIAYALGYDKKQSILKVTGTKAIVAGSLGRIESILTSQKFLKVFPEFQALINKYETIIKSRNVTEGKFTLYEGSPDFTFRIVNKETATNGVRANIIMLDDVCRAEDAENLTAHLSDVKRWNSEWKKRRHDEHNIMYIITGTAYHKEDIISTIIKDRLMNKRKTIVGDKGWKRFTGINDKKDTIFVSVPKIENFKKDRSLWKCTFPQKYTLTEAIKEMNADIRSFMAMDQQEPLNPDSLPFDATRCRVYEEVPQEVIDKGEVYVVVDPARKGKDYTVAAVLITTDDINYYCIDCYCKKRSMEESYEAIADIAIQYQVDNMILESNTESSVRKFMLKILAEKGYTSINRKNVQAIYSTENKEQKIARLRKFIVGNILYPDIYYYNDMSDMFQFLKQFHEYSLEHKNKHDDAPDTMAIFCDNVINKDKYKIPSLKVLDRTKLGI